MNDSKLGANHTFLLVWRLIAVFHQNATYSIVLCHCNVILMITLYACIVELLSFYLRF